MKKLLILAGSLLSFNIMANCPNLTGTYTCVNFEGKIYKQTVSIKTIENGISYVFSNKNNTISWNVDGKQNTNHIDSGAQKIKMLYRGTCKNHTYINEFMLDNKVNVVRGNSEFFLTPDGYVQKNTLIFPNDTQKKSTESCKRLD